MRNDVTARRRCGASWGWANSLLPRGIGIGQPVEDDLHGLRSAVG